MTAQPKPPVVKLAYYETAASPFSEAPGLDPKPYPRNPNSPMWVIFTVLGANVRIIAILGPLDLNPIRIMAPVMALLDL